MHQGVIIQVPVPEKSTGFYSNLFTVQKPNGDTRPILDLRSLNQYLLIQSFRMESVRSVVASLQMGDFLASIDIKDTYLHIPIFQPHERFLRFAVEERHF